MKQGKINASLPEGTTAESLTLEQAMELLAAKASSGKGAGRRRTTAGKAASGDGEAAARKPAKGKTATAAKATRSSTAGTARKTPATTKSGRLRASPVRVIRPAGNG